jgi:hypothetical protein
MIKLRLNLTDLGNTLNLYFVKEDVQGRIIAIAEPVELVFRNVQPGSSTPSTIELEGFTGQAMLSSLAKEIELLGIKPEEESKLEGKLEATTYHLEDMRRLIFQTDFVGGI